MAIGTCEAQIVLKIVEAVPIDVVDVEGKRTAHPLSRVPATEADVRDSHLDHRSAQSSRLFPTGATYHEDLRWAASVPHTSTMSAPNHVARVQPVLLGVASDKGRGAAIVANAKPSTDLDETAAFRDDRSQHLFRELTSTACRAAGRSFHKHSSTRFVPVERSVTVPAPIPKIST